jgi:hypothetical protein
MAIVGWIVGMVGIFTNPVVKDYISNLIDLIRRIIIAIRKEAIKNNYMDLTIEDVVGTMTAEDIETIEELLKKRKRDLALTMQVGLFEEG